MSIQNTDEHVDPKHAAVNNQGNESSENEPANVESLGEDGVSNIGSQESHHADAGSESRDRDLVDELRDLLGDDVVLLPIPSREKGPILSGWSTITVGQTRDPVYEQQLKIGNIGVLLGRASGGLCAIDLDDDQRVEPFLATNPALRSTLITKGKRGVQIWIRIDGEFPGSTRLKNINGVESGEWRADGNQSVINGVHPDGMRYRRINDARPIQIAFEDISWPRDLVLPWVKDSYQELVDEHGVPFGFTKQGFVINDYFFVVRYAKENLVLWEPLEQDFYGYQPPTGLWEIVTDDAIKWQIGRDLKRAADEVGVDDFLWKRTDSKLASFAKILRGVVGKRDAFKKRAPVIHLTNGMLDLKSEPPQLMTFHPDYCSRNICPIALDPEAECPRFTNELLRSALDEEDVDLLQRWAGSVLLGNNPAQRLLLLIGTAGGGKSTLIEVIEKVIGETNIAQLRTKHLNKQFEFYKFLGKTLLTGKDVNAEFLNEEGAEIIKALVGNDLLDAEKKYGNEHFQLRGNFNVAITCNSRLRVRLEGDSGAWERRLMIINYTKPKPKERITEFADKLIAAEGPGILNWMIEGAINYLQEIDALGDFQLTDDQKARIALLLSESDSVRQFVRNRVVPCDGSDVTISELQKGYFDYCEEQGWQAFTSQDFRGCIADLMLEIHRVSKRHDIQRDNSSAVRGFKHVMIMGGR